MREQVYRIGCGNVAFRTADGWSTSRQVGEFQVIATSFRHAAKLARAVMLSAADGGSEAEAFFGMLDEHDNYSTEQDTD